jgi:hypothetical protein
VQPEAKHAFFGFIIWTSSHFLFSSDQAASRSSNTMRPVDGGGVANEALREHGEDIFHGGYFIGSRRCLRNQ